MRSLNHTCTTYAITNSLNPDAARPILHRIDGCLPSDGESINRRWRHLPFFAILLHLHTEPIYVVVRTGHNLAGLL